MLKLNLRQMDGSACRAASVGTDVHGTHHLVIKKQTKADPCACIQMVNFSGVKHSNTATLEVLQGSMMFTKHKRQKHDKLKLYSHIS